MKSSWRSYGQVGRSGWAVQVWDVSDHNFEVLELGFGRFLGHFGGFWFLADLLVRLAELFEVLFELIVFWRSCMVVLFWDLGSYVLEIIFECFLGQLGGFSTWSCRLWVWPSSLSTLSSWSRGG